MTITDLNTIAFDADDTLWHSENHYADAQAKYRELLSRYHAPEWIDQQLYRTEMRNLKLFGYGAKGFALSLIETAIELTEGRIVGNEISEIIGYVRRMLETPIEPLEGVVEVLTSLAPHYTLILITKGDLLEQESKIARSGLADFFQHIEIVSTKDRAVYERIFNRHDIPPKRLMMVGNSLPSDVLPVVELGGTGVHIPYQITWQHESAEETEIKRYHVLASIRDLPTLLKSHT